jgi:hypothetical protein
VLVSHRHKFIYTKTLKTGGTSVESYFERFCMPEGEWSQSHWRNEYVSEAGIIGFRGPNMPSNCRWWNHMPAALIRRGIGEGAWAEYFKFCVVRNPFDKVVSAFYFVRRAANNPVQLADPARERALFEQWLLQGSQLPLDRDKYLIDGKFCLDEVVRYENLAGDLEKVCARLSVPWEPSLLPNFKSGIRPNDARVEMLYSERARKVVANVFAFELEYFGYKFPDEALSAGAE